MKRAAAISPLRETDAAAASAGRLQLPLDVKPASVDPLGRKWRRRKETRALVEDFLFKRRREVSLCLICLSLVVVIILTLRDESTSSNFYLNYTDKNSSIPQNSALSFLDKTGLPSRNKKKKDYDRLFKADVLQQRLREIPKRNKEPREDGHTAALQKTSFEKNKKDSNDLVGPTRFVMELSGLVGDVPSSRKVVIETRPDWAPLGVAHFHKLVQEGFYDQCRFFRVVPKFVVQFGIAADPLVQQKWRARQTTQKLLDDPVVKSNQRGTMTFATSGKNTRNTQLFINKKDNAYLDREGFAPFAQVLEGMEFIDLINAEYREKPNQGKIQRRGNEYLNEEFPNLSYIATLREEPQGEDGNHA